MMKHPCRDATVRVFSSLQVERGRSQIRHATRFLGDDSFRPFLCEHLDDLFVRTGLGQRKRSRSVVLLGGNVSALVEQ
jgi:hypothetical protein